MKNKIVLTLASLAFASVAAAADDGFKISGDLATSLFVESGKGQNNEFASTGAISSPENSGDFSVDMMELNLEKTIGNSGFVVGIGYGRVFDLINNTIPTGGAAPKSTLNLTNAYFHHKLGETGLSFKLGKFGSGVGYETYNYMNNMNYTRSYAFNRMNPWFFTGLAADYTINEMVSVGAVVANTNTNSDTDENQSKHMGVNATVKPMEGLTVKLNYLVGKEGDIAAATPAIAYTDATRLNATVMYTLNSMYDFAFHYSNMTQEPLPSGTELEVTSMALYAGAKMETWGAGLRYEMITDDDNIIFTGTTLDNSAAVITATGWYNVDQNAVLKLEIASTSADEQVFVDDEGAADDAMMTYGLGFMYRF